MIKRNPAFYVTVVITPSFIINVLCIVGLFLKSDRTTKLEMALTNILSLTFILGILAAVLPKSSQIPKIGIFIVINLALMVASLGIVLLLPYLRCFPVLVGYSENGPEKKELNDKKAHHCTKKATMTARILDLVLLTSLELCETLHSSGNL
ncbi:hypothetical protein COOONC_19233 [Cooperia oncophora]